MALMTNGYRLIPDSFQDFPLLRSYAALLDGVLHRVEVRRDPASQQSVQVARPMPSKLQPRKET